ncbi:DNA-3-methyladenine glycosylase I [Herbiconiux sp. KACC 21604]|uniref:DNA-3-methyladenine glycosylase I n=1 Tax=unclassified Herbiconiux TaxID=2618217 RepID=UPI001493162F|nr:DNA-3-methyladenine glycosylase I [Herbiconiux sp. SALV-R1]QJU54913.1 DNA-3-methyladenine glycosylase I [Herbiconiux sp. SALV-R1]WPO86037.1 DNA-3-methyladenine glycosylase I [Herbiconiux sp. KACC 21604]
MNDTAPDATAFDPHDGTCAWANGSPAMRRYHDAEWGVPSHDDRHLFEMLLLEGAQAGLSWSTILGRRAGYSAAFREFDVEAVAQMSDGELEVLMNEPGIIRNRLKIYGARKNALAFQRVQQEFGSFAAYLWGWAPGGEPIVAHPRGLGDLPATSELSDRLSKDLKKRGFTFVGSTIVYAYLQSTGVVDDHVDTCPRKGVAP